MSDFNFELSRSIKVKCEGEIRLPVYGFLLKYKSNIGHN